MRKEVEDLLRTEKERIFASGKQKRDKHLISIGLIDEGKTSRFYVGEDGYDSNNALYDNEKLKYYSENVGALDVTDEEYAEICKYFPQSKKEDKVDNLNRLGNLKNDVNIITMVRYKI